MGRGLVVGVVCGAGLLLVGCGGVGVGELVQPAAEIEGGRGANAGTVATMSGVEAAVATMSGVEAAAVTVSGVEAAAVTEAVTMPQVLRFGVIPTITLNVGEPVVIAWDALGDTAELCPIAGQPVMGACISTPLSGTMVLTTSEAMLTYDSLGLRVAVGDEFTWATQNVAFQCQNLRTWFFAPPPARCPEADAVASAATTQPFEHGFMVWFEASNTYYVFYDAGGADYPSPVVQIVTGPLDALQTATTTPSPVATPPAGMSAPAGDFGRLWRGEVAGVDGVAGGLGWATGPETTYQSDYQCEMSGMMHGWTCYLLGPDGDVLRLWPDSTAQVHILWTRVHSNVGADRKTQWSIVNRQWSIVNEKRATPALPDHTKG